MEIKKSQNMSNREKLVETWAKACEFDGIAPDGMFIVFSKRNLFAVAYNQMMGELLAQRKAVR